jgi:hypothetical protein
MFRKSDFRRALLAAWSALREGGCKRQCDRDGGETDGGKKRGSRH